MKSTQGIAYYIYGYAAMIIVYLIIGYQFIKNKINSDN